jgi:hypothetical protein
MAEKRYTLIEFEDDGVVWELHKPGCPEIPKPADNDYAFAKKLIKADLEWADDQLLEVLDPGERLSEVEEVALCQCTGYGPPEESSEQESDLEEDELDEDDEEDLPPATSAAARASQAAAKAKLLKQVEEAIDKIVAERGVDDVGTNDLWAEERLPTCQDDYVYDLAVEVRKLRTKGESWWRVAYELGLPGSGASNKQGRKGSAFARRLWRAAWGKTYLGERGQRDSKLTREARAMENLGRSYFSEDVTDAEVIKLVTGQMLHWVTRLKVKEGLVTSAQEAYVHHDPHLVKVRQGPQGRYLEFYEQVDAAQLRVDPRLAIAKSGPQRAVYVDRITRVGV